MPHISSKTVNRNPTESKKIKISKSADSPQQRLYHNIERINYV